MVTIVCFGIMFLVSVVYSVVGLYFSVRLANLIGYSKGGVILFYAIQQEALAGWKPPINPVDKEAKRIYKNLKISMRAFFSLIVLFSALSILLEVLGDAS